MLKIEKTEVVGWEAVICGIHSSMNSWEKIDSGFGCGNNNEYFCDNCSSSFHCTSLRTTYNIGPNDLDLMTRLRNAGTDHRKFMRMIAVYADITAPLYWLKEFDTYKVGTVANSYSTMHKIAAKEFTLDDFSHEHLMNLIDYEEDRCSADDLPVFEEKDGKLLFWTPTDILAHTISGLNFYRQRYLETKSKPMKEETKRVPLMKKYWWQMIQLLPSSYNQRRTVMLNYEVLANIYKSRRNHKLDEWHEFCKWIEGLPYSELITGKKKNNDALV